METHDKCGKKYQSNLSQPKGLQIQDYARHLKIDMEMTAHILLNLPEAYYNIVENLEDKLYDEIDPLTIKYPRQDIIK